VDRFDGFQVPTGRWLRSGTGSAGADGGSAGSVRLGSPAEVAAAIPHFFGFHPDSSVVVVGLARSDHDGRAAINHGLRVDLSAAEKSPAAFGRWTAARLLETGANEALCVIYPPAGGPVRMSEYRRLVAGMCTPLRVAGVAPLDVLFVAGNRWWSFLCDRASCCPPEGSPVDARASAIAALSAYSGLAVLPNRAALAAGLEPYGADMPDRMRAACDAALNRVAAERLGPDPAASAAQRSAAVGPSLEPGGSDRPATGIPESAASELHEGAAGPRQEPRVLDFDWDDVVRAWGLADGLCDGQVPPDRALSDEIAGELLVAIVDVRVRDYLATWCGDDRAGQAVALGVELARRSVTSEQAAAAYAVAAWASWALGWGAWSRLCLERAARAAPGYPLASLIRQGLERGVGPELVREAARGTARRLDEMHSQQAVAGEQTVVRIPRPADPHEPRNPPAVQGAPREDGAVRTGPDADRQVFPADRAASTPQGPEAL
jgi:hypothetical protein